jgi:leucyl-tRNA synthetase
VLGTVLANEEIINGLSERGSHTVVRQPLRQWVLKITQYADRLEKDLESLSWPEGTLAAQKQWIGRSEGALIKFKIKGSDEHIEVFTTRLDTVMGVTYLVLAPEHPVIDKLIPVSERKAVDDYRGLVSKKSDLERTVSAGDKQKSGVPLALSVIHPLIGKEIPVWTSDYVISTYGTGAVMAVPAHDERDFDFATKFNLPMVPVITGLEGGQIQTLPYDYEGILMNSGSGFDGLSSKEAREKITSILRNKDLGRQKVSYKLRDWVFSRQRYWGEPIPIYFPVELLPDSKGLSSPIDGAPHKICYDQPIAVDENELPLKLPDMDDFHPGDDPQGCLARAKEWRYFQKDGKWFARETNTMPQVDLF